MGKQHVVKDGPLYSPTPAQQLVGKELENGWKVEKLIDRPESATGGNFSTSYIVRSSNGREAFLKAMDYMSALKASDPAAELQLLTAAFIFERSLLEKCRARRLSRIIRVLDGGRISAQGGDSSSVVQYLIFELAKGDIRSIVDFEVFETVWALRILHEAAAALQQLHSVQIAHQDLKPSNVLLFENHRTKLGDLGRAFDLRRTAPHDDFSCAGDQTYAPPELLYGHVVKDWRIRRIGCDMYLLGSLAIYFCTELSMTNLLYMRLNEEHNWKNWGGTYSEVLPYLQHVFTQIIRELRDTIRTDFADELCEVVKQLCDPDPLVRGNPMYTKATSRYSLERYVSVFDRLASKAEFSLTRRDSIRRAN